MNNKGADQTARMRRLVCAFVVRKPPKTGFLATRPICCIVSLISLRRPALNRGSYISAHVLLDLLNKFGKGDKIRGLPSILLLFRNEFNKSNNTRSRMLYSIYHRTLKLIENHILA